MGIGKQNEFQDLADFVLAPMRMSDEQKLGLNKAIESVQSFVEGERIDLIMGKFNS